MRCPTSEVSKDYQRYVDNEKAKQKWMTRDFWRRKKEEEEEEEGGERREEENGDEEGWMILFGWTPQVE